MSSQVPDARIKIAFPDHPKTVKLLRRCGEAGTWSLVCLFLWTAGNRATGDLAGMTDEDVEIVARWRGAPGALVVELRALGFLDGDEGAYRVHDWAEHNPWASGAQARSVRGQWNAHKRHHGEEEADRLFPEYAAQRRGGAPSSPAGNADSTGTDADSTAGAATSNAPSPSPSPSPSPLPNPEGESRSDRPSEARAAAAIPPTPIDPTMAGRVCLAVRKAGMMQTNPLNPELRALLAEFGDAPDLLLLLFEEAARDAVERSKGFGWVVGAVRGRINDARTPVVPAKRLSLADQVRVTNAALDRREGLPPGRRLSASEQVLANALAGERRDQLGLADAAALKLRGIAERTGLQDLGFDGDFIRDAIPGESTVIPKGEA